MNVWTWLAIYLGVSLVLFIALLEVMRWVSKRENDQETLAVIACVDSQLGWSFAKFTCTWPITVPLSIAAVIIQRAKTRSGDSE